MESKTATLKTFVKTIEVFNKIAQKITGTSSNTATGIELIEYQVSDKQFDWLAKTYIQEAGGWDTRYAASVTDEEGNFYALDYSRGIFNVPHYIPNRAKYGKKYTITKSQKICPS